MAGSVLVVPGDLTRIGADVICYSTDVNLTGTGLMHASFCAGSASRISHSDVYRWPCTLPAYLSLRTKAPA
jgi:hypothetical protein